VSTDFKDQFITRMIPLTEVASLAGQELGVSDWCEIFYS
jgi:hypothetical protein